MKGDFQEHLPLVALVLQKQRVSALGVRMQPLSCQEHRDSLVGLGAENTFLPCVVLNILLSLSGPQFPQLCNDGIG